MIFDNFCKESLCVSCYNLQSREKKAPFSIFGNELSQIIQSGHGDPLSCVFRETIFDNVSNENSYFSCFDLQVCKKIASFNEGSPIIFLSQGNSTSCVFRKIFFNNFCKEGLCVSCSDLQAREKISPFSIYRNELSQPFTQAWRPQELCFYKYIFRQHL